MKCYCDSYRSPYNLVPKVYRLLGLRLVAGWKSFQPLPEEAVDSGYEIGHLAVYPCLSHPLIFSSCFVCLLFFNVEPLSVKTFLASHHSLSMNSMSWCILFSTPFERSRGFLHSFQYAINCQKVATAGRYLLNAMGAGLVWFVPTLTAFSRYLREPRQRRKASVVTQGRKFLIVVKPKLTLANHRVDRHSSERIKLNQIHATEVKCGKMCAIESFWF